MIDIQRTYNENDLVQCAFIMSKAEPWKTLQINSEKCLVALRSDLNEVHIVTEEKKLIGFAILQMKGLMTGYIQTVCIIPEYRNRGIGTTLLKYCEENIFKISPNSFICYSSFNPNAGKLYKKLGYELIGELKNFIIDGQSEILLRKTIGPRSSFVPAAL